MSIIEPANEEFSRAYVNGLYAILPVFKFAGRVGSALAVLGADVENS